MPLPAHALAILLGVVAAVIIGERRWVDRGGTRGLVTDVATIAVPASVVGARIYHVITSPGPYLEDPVSALYVWQGGLGIPGGIAAGFLAGCLMLRRPGVSTGAFRRRDRPWRRRCAGNRSIPRLHQELVARPTTLPWGLRIDADNPDAVHVAIADHPTSRYESLWHLAVAALVVRADRRFRLGHGRAFARYLGACALGRAWIEALRIDDAGVRDARLHDARHTAATLLQQGVAPRVLWGEAE